MLMDDGNWQEVAGVLEDGGPSEQMEDTRRHREELDDQQRWIKAR